MNWHRHDWRRVYSDGVGRYSKRDSEIDAVYFVGDIETCECGRARLKARGFTPVEIETA